VTNPICYDGTMLEDIEDIIEVWQAYLKTVPSWEELIGDTKPKVSGCGLLYELPNPITNRPNESFAIADMRSLDYFEPHKHIHGETEIYFVLQGTGVVAIGDEIHRIGAGDVVATPPDSIHTLVQDNLVLAVVNTPPFDPNNYIVVDDTNPKIVAIIKRLHDEK
jgi:mannose-6-phosphate isomerase-like protein (cupin superfamily)